MLMVKIARGRADVAWDCITVSPDDEGYLFGDDDGRALVNRMVERFQALAKGAPGRPEFYGSSFTGSVRRLPLPVARLLAEEYVQMLYLPTRTPDASPVG